MSSVLNNVNKKDIYELAKKLNEHTQIPNQYFEIGSLFLVNRSFSSDPDRFQEYAVYKRDAFGNGVEFESVTVNVHDDGGQSLGDWLLNWERIPFHECRHPISGTLLSEYSPIPAKNFEFYKNEFKKFQQTY
ncbi:hypothetical protein ACTWQB_16540 [Piscibacillus sp. B03]|uniref:hypothetical protein n=1 Tax=Piscibacillus sp. B03 TaxID=3457430 RepID=UPI003FCD26DB